MNRFFVIIMVIFGISLNQIEPHSFSMPSKLKLIANELNKGRDLPIVWSYHIHVQFVNHDNSSISAAMNLREKFINHFNLSHVPVCKSTFDDIRLCMFDIELIPDNNSPFLSGNWAVMVPIGHFSETSQWIMQNRGDSDLLIHPNTGAEVSDHVRWSLKNGQDWPLNIAAFSNQTFF